MEGAQVTKRLSVAVAGLAVLVIMAACGDGDPTPTSTAPPPEASPTPTAAPPTPAPSPMPVPPDADVLGSAQMALQQGQERWEKSGIADYVYTGAWTCFCPEAYLAQTQVTVGGGKVTDVSSAAQNIDTIPAPERFVPVEALFALIQNAITQGAARVEVSYDATHGYPSKLFVDYDERMADEEDLFVISSFAPR